MSSSAVTEDQRTTTTSNVGRFMAESGHLILQRSRPIAKCAIERRTAPIVEVDLTVYDVGSDYVCTVDNSWVELEAGQWRSES